MAEDDGRGEGEAQDRQQTALRWREDEEAAGAAEHVPRAERIRQGGDGIETEQQLALKAPQRGRVILLDF